MLLSLGLTADRSVLISRLRCVGYYRLSAYLHLFWEQPFGSGTKYKFRDGTTLSLVWEHYLFDRRLRFALIDAIERIEVALRSMITYYHCQGHSPFDYAAEDYFPEWKGYMQKLGETKGIQKRNWKSGIDHADNFFSVYGDKYSFLPLWMAVCLMDFATVTRFYEHSIRAIRQSIAKELGLDSSVLLSWLQALRWVRNDCAHHARVWNKVYPSAPKLRVMPHLPWHYVYSPKAGKWVKPGKGSSGETLGSAKSKIGPMIVICCYLLRRIAPTSHWRDRMEAILDKAANTGINVRLTGLPLHWQMHPIWRG